MNRLRATLAAAMGVAALACSANAGAQAVEPAHPMQPQTQTQRHVGHMRCGGALLESATTYLDDGEHDRQALDQRLSLTPPGLKKPLALTHDGKPFTQPFMQDTPVLDASATGWACIKATSGRSYVYVMYTCVESPLRPACVGTAREWARLFNTRGKLLNPGYPHDGPQTPTLMRKLGLARYVDTGVALDDVDSARQD